MEPVIVKVAVVTYGSMGRVLVMVAAVTCSSSIVYALLAYSLWRLRHAHDAKYL